MRGLDAPRGLLAGSGLVLAVTAAILAQDFRSRAGGPTATLVLTERELAMPLTREQDDTGLELTLVTSDRLPEPVAIAARWRRITLPPFEFAWLDAGKLRALGFDPDAILGRLDEDDRDPSAGVLPRVAFVVLENEGPAWEAWIAGAEGSEPQDPTRVAIDRESRSRLMPIDAGSDPEALRKTYSDASRYAVVPASIGVEVERGKDGASILRGRIHGLRAAAVHVPIDFLPRLEPFLPGPDRAKQLDRLRTERETGLPPPEAPRYRATVSFGRDGRPWLVSVEPIVEPRRKP